MKAFGNKWYRNNPWITSDSHFYHFNIVKFNNSDGSPLRPWDDYLEMTEELISNWNEVVKEDDQIIHLGDIAFGGAERFHQLMPRLNGKKVLVMGNHDTRTIPEYLMYFEDVRSLIEIPKKAVMSHVPLHESQLRRFGKSIHGHLHSSKVRDSNGKTDDRYINVCVEQTNYYPIRLDDILE